MLQTTKKEYALQPADVLQVAALFLFVNPEFVLSSFVLLLADYKFRTVLITATNCGYLDTDVRRTLICRAYFRWLSSSSCL
jgi:hypothetical protein